METKMEKEVVKEEKDEGLKNPKIGMRYVYFGRNNENNKHNGVTCVGYEVIKDLNKLKVSVAFCSPEDTFSKKKARLIINGRTVKQFLLVDSVEGEAPFVQMDYEAIINIIKRELNALVPKVDVPDQKLPIFAGTTFPRWFTGV